MYTALPGRRPMVALTRLISPIFWCCPGMATSQRIISDIFTLGKITRRHFAVRTCHVLVSSWGLKQGPRHRPTDCRLPLLVRNYHSMGGHRRSAPPEHLNMDHHTGFSQLRREGLLMFISAPVISMGSSTGHPQNGHVTQVR